MILKRWGVILGLAAVGLALLGYWMTLPGMPAPGVVPQSGDDDQFKNLAALAGAVTTLGTAVFGVLSKFNDFRAKRLEIALAEVELEKKKRELEEADAQ